jgi:hypothetical protein
MRITLFALLLSIFVTVSPATPSAEEQNMKRETRPGVTMHFMVTRPAGNIRAAAILFAGGSGKLKLWKHDKPKSKNFLVRSRQLFADRNILTITVDVPSDRRKRGFRNFRHSADHRTDIKSILDWVRGQTDTPVWLIGTSRGTVSIAHLGAALEVNGLVMTASVTREGQRSTTSVTDAPLNKISAPLYMGHHRNDECIATVASDLEGIAKQLVSSRKVTVRLFSGGLNKGSNPCRENTHHGFLGIEEKVIDDIVSWMMATTSGP